MVGLSFLAAARAAGLTRLPSKSHRRDPWTASVVEDNSGVILHVLAGPAKYIAATSNASDNQSEGPAIYIIDIAS